ncbi:hypothetical protein MSHOH_2153 [Methanosarcina horonobensis HB-1 = JCM 15518]|uniref:Uncharacterized protein n=1 Tax=Methanosarcina horonobensis HB-1 = JCM 15518 TaxID=1434110 RepID=A0A0E3SCM0_9EURY|nr:hypothetical protein [Methanosarcina horonobensis]AKB78636.1 hypothetical protein MSHOH_2153 [Methanosarcina horonobensis HB-1 = JCM 15518]
MLLIILLIIIVLLGIATLTLFGYLLVSLPFALPYLITKFKNGILLILKTDTGNYRFVPLSNSYNSKTFGTFIPNPDAIMRIAGISVAFASQKMAVIPSQEACVAGTKLKEARADVYTNINQTAAAAEQKGILTKVDVDALYMYSQNISPNFVEKRIAIRTAEILAQNKDQLQKMMGYAMVFFILLIGAGIAWHMISSGSGSAVVDTISTAAGTAVNI